MTKTTLKICLHCDEETLCRTSIHELGARRYHRSECTRCGCLSVDVLPALARPFGPSLTEERFRSVCRAVAVAFGVETTDLTGRSRRRCYVFPRHVAMYVLREHGYALTEIGRRFKRDHSTVWHAVRRMRWDLASYPILRSDVDRISKLLERMEVAA